MLSLGQARRMRGAAGDLLPSPYRAFDDFEIRFRRGQLVLIVAGPGTGKSTMVLNLALRMRVPTLYLSADSNEFTQVSRAYRIVTGASRERGDQYSLGEFDDPRNPLKDYPTRWSFSASPSEDDIQLSMESFQALYGRYPYLLIVDNITNVLIDQTDRPSVGIESLMDFLNDTARQTSACVIGLHHANGPFANGQEPIPLNGIKEQPHRVPQMILTQFRPGDGRIGVSKVKDREGPYDPSGQWFAELAFDPETMRITDIA